MPERKKLGNEMKDTAAPVCFTKEQILASDKFKNIRDLVDALLDKGKNYTLEQVDKLVNNFMKGKVK